MLEGTDWDAAIAEEQAQVKRVRDIAAELAEAARPVWHLGDGYGGCVKADVSAAFAAAGLELTPPPTRKRSSLSTRRRKRIMERDGHICLQCGSHINLTIDHIVPVVRGGGDEDSNLQTLCWSCNGRKGARLL